MSRSGYYDDCSDDHLAYGRWRGTVARALRGKRGQAFLRELAASLDAMPDKRLIANELQVDGQFCALGVLGAARGIDMTKLDPEDYYSVAEAFGIAPCMVQEIVFQNDEAFVDFEWTQVELCGPRRPTDRRFSTVRQYFPDAAERRWKHMRAWVQEQLDRYAQPPTPQEELKS